MWYMSWYVLRELRYWAQTDILSQSPRKVPYAIAYFSAHTCSASSVSKISTTAVSLRETSVMSNAWLQSVVQSLRQALLLPQRNSKKTTLWSQANF